MHQQYITQICFLQVTTVAYKIVCCLKLAPVIQGIVNVLLLAKCNVLLILECIINFSFLNIAHYNIVRLHQSLYDVKSYAEACNMD